MPDKLPLVPTDIDAIFRCGGQALIEFLEYCVRSVETDAVFAFLVREYRGSPTDHKALALYEMFCAATAPARISAQEALPPTDVRLKVAIQPLQERRNLIGSLQGKPPELIPPSILPAPYLFDFLVRRLEDCTESWFRRLSEWYDPHRPPLENLPGGRMSPAQRAFVEKVWEPQVRPRLVSAGFRRVANIA